MSKSLSGSAEEYRELTLRGMILGALITIIFTASNVYLGLKVGLTFASSIPAAVISMAVLKFFKGKQYFGKQHGADAGFGGGYAFDHHLRSARFVDGGLLERFPVLADDAFMYCRRDFRGDFYHSAALRDGGKKRAALPRRCGCC